MKITSLKNYDSRINTDALMICKNDFFEQEKVKKLRDFMVIYVKKLHFSHLAPKNEHKK